MTKYIAKPALFNNKGMKEFTDAKEAIEYLNGVLKDEGVNPELEYVFIAPKTSETIQCYGNIVRISSSGFGLRFKNLSEQDIVKLKYGVL